MRPTKYRKDKVAAFISKLFEILQDERSESIIEWTEQKDAFVILDLASFTNVILPLYFKHSNYSSFIRQLNMYNFTKKRLDGKQGEAQHVYQNEMFLGYDSSRLREIRRKQTISRPQLSLTYGQNFEGKQDNVNGSQDEQSISEPILTLQEKLHEIKQKQDNLRQICYRLIQQNQMLITQNQDLSNRIKKDSKKKDRIINQVFRIVGASITQFWGDICEQDQDIEKRAQSLQELYTLLMDFIQNNQMSQIMKALEFFLQIDQKQKKIFKIMTQNQGNLFHSYTEEQVNQFISATSLLL